LDWTQGMQAVFAVASDVMSLFAQAKVVFDPLPLLELQAAVNEATEATARAARLRKPIMKEPPEVSDVRWTALPAPYSAESPEMPSVW
jgi:hypothetical protein